MNDFNKKLSEAFKRVGSLEGVVAVRGGDIGIQGRHFDDYLAMADLGQLLERGEIEIKVAPSRLEYLFKLLKVEESEK